MTQGPGFPPEGWYPNPGNPEQQRWWDGHAWTDDVAVGAPMAPGATPDNPAAPAGYQPPQQAQAPYQPQYTQPQQYGQPYAQPQQYPPHPGQQPQQPPYPQQYPQQYPPQPPGYGSYPGYGAYPQPKQRGVMDDGARVAGWWWRFLARWLDSIVTAIPTLVFGLSQIRHIYDSFSDYVDQVNAANAAGTTVPTFDGGSITRDVLVLIAIQAVVAILYEALMLKFCSATVGKLICGLRVRLWQVRGSLSWGTVVKRVLGYQVIAAIPNVGGLYVLVDCLWPLWDGNRQALHDKLADTAVVKKHDAALAPQPYGGAGSFGSYSG